MEKEKDQFFTCVKKYKDAMKFAREHRGKFERFIYSVARFKFSYIRYTLARYRLPILFGGSRITLFWGKKMILPASDIGTHVLGMYGIIPHGCERKLTVWMMQNFTKTDVFYDVGVHLGFYMALAEFLSPEGEVHGFEANKSLCAYAQRNFEKNMHVHMNCVAVASHEGVVDFYDATDTHDSSESSRFNIVNASTLPNKIPATTLDAYVASGKSVPTIIKLDIEGGEYDAIIGAEKIITEHRPKIIMEIWGGELGMKYSDSAVKKLQSLGYYAYAVTVDGSLSQASVDNPVLSITNGEVNPRDNFVFVYKK